MPSRPRPIYFTDENALGLGKLLARSGRDDVRYPGHENLPEVPLGTPDVEWMTVVARRDFVVVTRDRRIRTRPAELRRYHELGIRSVRIGAMTNGETMSDSKAFWNDLAHDLEDPEFLREYIIESMRIATVDAIVNELDEARKAAGLSKADLARAIQVEPATIRRLFATERPNPTLGTLAEVAAALGMRVTLEPLPKPERATVTEPLLRGKAADTRNVARHLEQMRGPIQ